MCGFQGVGCRVPVSGFRVWNLGFGVWGCGLRVYDLGFGVYDSEAAEARCAGPPRVAELPQELQGENLP